MNHLSNTAKGHFVKGHFLNEDSKVNNKKSQKLI